MKLKIPAVVKSMLTKRGAMTDRTLRATKAQLIKTCGEHGYKPHAAVIDFEASFGGMLIPDGPKMKKDEPVWLFGTYACVTTGGHSSPGRGKKIKLVPVVNSPNDIIYYLDEQGRGYAEDTIEDVSPVRYADDATSLVCRIVFDDALFSRKETSLNLEGLQGSELSKQLKLKLVKEASGNDRRFYTDKTGDILIAEDIKEKRTLFAGATKKHLKLVQQQAAPAADKKETKSTTSLSFRGSKIHEPPASLADEKNLTELNLTECENLDVDKALLVIAKLPKLKELSLPLSQSLTSLAPLANVPIKTLYLRGTHVKHPDRLPSGLSQLKKLKDLRIEYADDIAQLPEAAEDIRALRLLFSPKFTDDDIRQSAARQPEKLYLQAFVKTL